MNLNPLQFLKALYQSFCESGLSDPVAWMRKCCTDLEDLLKDFIEGLIEDLRTELLGLVCRKYKTKVRVFTELDDDGLPPQAIDRITPQDFAGGDTSEVYNVTLSLAAAGTPPAGTCGVVLAIENLYEDYYTVESFVGRSQFESSATVWINGMLQGRVKRSTRSVSGGQIPWPFPMSPWVGQEHDMVEVEVASDGLTVPNVQIQHTLQGGILPPNVLPGVPVGPPPGLQNVGHRPTAYNDFARTTIWVKAWVVEQETETTPC